jgi:hypothetical protein
MIRRTIYGIPCRLLTCEILIGPEDLPEYCMFFFFVWLLTGDDSSLDTSIRPDIGDDDTKVKRLKLLKLLHTLYVYVCMYVIF